MRRVTRLGLALAAATLLATGCAAPTDESDEPSCVGQKCDLSTEAAACEVEGYQLIEPNESQAEAHVLGAYSDGQSLDIVTGLESDTDVDWYVIDLEDRWLGDLQPSFWVRPDGEAARDMGTAVKVCGYYVSRDGQSLEPETCGNADHVDDEYGRGCCSRWSTDAATVRMDVTAAFRDDSGLLHMRVMRDSSDDAQGESSCLPYSLSIRL